MVLWGGQNSSATGINYAGKIVGNANVANGAGHAFLYSNGVMTDLNTLIDTTQGWTLVRATDINDFGAIVGLGTLNGVTHGFRLIPNPTITSYSVSSGSAGTNITIYGTNFCDPSPQYPGLFCNTPNNHGLNAVKFGSVFQTFNYVYPTMISVTVPNGAASAPLEVITPYAVGTGPLFTVQ